MAYADQSPWQTKQNKTPIPFDRFYVWTIIKFIYYGKIILYIVFSKKDAKVENVLQINAIIYQN